MRLSTWIFFLLTLGLFGTLSVACGDDEKDEGSTDADTDTDSDTDVDTDTPTEMDSDTPTEMDTDACSPAATIEEVCAIIFDPCDGYGFLDEVNCVACFINGDTDCPFTAACTDESAYFDCMCACITETLCEDFQPCEAACWDSACL